MIRNVGIFLGVLLALAITVGCGDDDDKPTNLPDANYPDGDGGCIGPRCGSDVDNDSDEDVAPDCPPGQHLENGECLEDGDTPFPCGIEAQEPCGGDVSGVWEFVESCELEEPAFETSDTCGPGGTYLHWYYYEYVGTITFNSTGQYQMNVVRTTHNRATVSEDCAGEVGCDIHSSFYGLGTCTLQDGYCDCEGENEDPIDLYEGNYTVSGTELVFDGDTPSPYCVSDNTMYLRRALYETFEPLRLQRGQ